MIGESPSSSTRTTGFLLEKVLGKGKIVRGGRLHSCRMPVPLNSHLIKFVIEMRLDYNQVYTLEFE